jgi:AraC-like DNA-binding protein
VKLPIVTDLVSYNYTSLPRGYSLEAHLHHYFQFDVVLAGAVTISLEGFPQVRTRAGDAVVIPALVRHGYRTRSGWTQGSFKFHLAPAWWSLLSTNPKRMRLPRPLMEAVHFAGKHERESFASQQALAVANLCMIEFLRQARQNRRSLEHLDPLRRTLWPLLEEVAREPFREWSVATLAKQCHLSVDHFSKRFHELLGQSPHRYLFEERMRAAASELLADPPRPIKEIAGAANYATVHAFTAAFTKAFGISPAAYRRKQTEL